MSKITPNRIVKLFLRFAIASAFLSAVLDRFGIWPEEQSAWGNWENFVSYTGQLLPWLPDFAVNFMAIIATAAEVVFSILLLSGYKVGLTAKLSGFLLLSFAFAMSISLGIKASLDYSVFTASSSAFALWLIDKEGQKELLNDYGIETPTQEFP